VIARSNEPEGTLRDFDLREYSVRNYARHRRVRYLVALLCFAIVSVFTCVDFFAVLAGEGRGMLGLAIFLVSVTAFVLYLFVALCFQAIRYLAPPPVGMRIDPNGLTFVLRTGHETTVLWTKPFLFIKIYLRPATDGLPTGARFWMMTLVDRTDEDFIWRRLVPVTYLSKEAIDSVVDSATAVGLRIEREDGCTPLSSYRSIPCTQIRITP